MKISYLLALLVLLFIGGIAGYFEYSNRVADPNWRGEVEATLGEIQTLDTKINEIALKSRQALIADYDQLSKLPREVYGRFDHLTALLQRQPTTNLNLTNNMAALRNVFVNKEDVLENFKSHNSIFHNSLRHAPEAGYKLQQVAEKDGTIEDVNSLRATVRALLAYSLQGKSHQADLLSGELRELSTLDTRLPEFAQVMVFEFLNHSKTVLREKEITDKYLSVLLASPILKHITAMRSSVIDSVATREVENSYLNYSIFAYLGLIGLGLAYLSLRLRQTYQQQDEKVEERTAEIEQAHNSLKDSQEQLIQAEKMSSIGQMVSGVAHEIATPLGYINNNIGLVNTNIGELDPLFEDLKKMSVEVSLPKPENAQILGLLKSIVSEYRRLRKEQVIDETNNLLKDSQYGVNEIDQLINSLRDLSRVGNTLDVKDFDINVGLNSTLKLCNAHLDKITVDKDFNELPLIECSPSKINQVFMNIITNAAQASEGQGTLKITTRLDEHDSSQVKISFTDSGEGITKADLAKIFDPFFTTKDVGEGTGLGLSIAHKIILSHGGDIIVDSLPGQGSTFTVILPIKYDTKVASSE